MTSPSLLKKLQLTHTHPTSSKPRGTHFLSPSSWNVTRYRNHFIARGIHKTTSLFSYVHMSDGILTKPTPFIAKFLEQHLPQSQDSTHKKEVNEQDNRHSDRNSATTFHHDAFRKTLMSAMIDNEIHIAHPSPS